MISAANVHLSFLSAGGFYLEEFVFQSFLLNRDGISRSARFMRINLAAAQRGAMTRRDAMRSEAWRRNMWPQAQPGK
jgi:hypothetical protein